MEQIIYFGYHQLTYILKKFKRIFLVHGNSFYDLEMSKLFENMNIVKYSAFSSNPKYEDILNGVHLFNSETCDAIVAIGGGSSIDVAKCIKLFANINNSLDFINNAKINLEVPLIAIPTTAGSGSESTSSAVMYINGEKKSVKHWAILPKYVFLIPETLRYLPLYQKKSTLLDAYSQAIESLWSIKSNRESRFYSKKAIKLIKENWRGYINNDLNTFMNIMLASNYSGRAINIAETTLAHAMSYKITTLYGLAHGHAVSVCLKEVWPFIKENVDKSVDTRGTEYLKKIISEIENYSSYEWFLDFFNQLQLWKPKTNNIEKDISSLVNSVNHERLSNTPVQVDKTDLKEMYERIIENEN